MIGYPTPPWNLDSLLDMQSLENRIKSFTKKWPHHKEFSGMRMAMAGFFFDPSPGFPDATECFVCKKSLDGWTNDDDPWDAHINHGSMVPDPITLFSITNLSEFMNPRYVPQASINEQKRIPCPLTTLELEESRLYTFKYWKKPIDSYIANPMTLSKAGFYLFPKKHADDLCICYCCGLGLDSWSKDDDPVIEHTKRKPDCPHILGKARNQNSLTFNYHLFLKGQDLGSNVVESPPIVNVELSRSEIKTPSNKRKMKHPQSHIDDSIHSTIRRSTRLMESKLKISQFDSQESNENVCNNTMLRRETLDPLKTPSRRIGSKQNIPLVLRLDNESKHQDENVTIKKRKKQPNIQINQAPPVPMFQEHKPNESIHHPYEKLFNSDQLEEQLKQFQDMTLGQYFEWMIRQYVQYFEMKMKMKISDLIDNENKDR